MADVNGPHLADEIEGLSLPEAIERFSDPEKWRIYAAASAAAAGKRRTGFFCFDGEPIAGWDAYNRAQAGNRLIDAAERAWLPVYVEFLARLQSGELVATGFRVPVDPAIGRQVIATDLWTVLLPNFWNSSARGGGCEFVGIRVSRRPVSAPFGALPVSRDAEEQRSPSFPGRPSVMAAIEQEMRRRAAQGELRGRLIEECKHLAQWARSEFEGRQTPKARSIENALRTLYRELAARKPGTK